MFDHTKHLAIAGATFALLGLFAAEDAAAQSAGCDALNGGLFQGQGNQSITRDFDEGDQLAFSFGTNNNTRFILKDETAGFEIANQNTGLPTGAYTVPSSGARNFTFRQPGSGGPVFLSSSSCTAALPRVDGVSPAGGAAIGGTVVTVTGVALGGATSVTFGGVAGSGITNNTATSLQVTAPAGAGTVNVLVTTPVGTSTNNATADDFVYAAPPAQVPTLSEWAMILLAGLLGASALAKLSSSRRMI